jgi:peptide methionine sulfoxide reductase MsrA
MTPHQVAILAGGCFWGMQDLFRKYPHMVERMRAEIHVGHRPDASA